MAIDTLRSAAHLQRELGDELFLALISSDNTAAVKQFLLGLQPLLTPVGTIMVRPELEFNPSARFVVSVKKAPTMFSYVGDNFKASFLSPRRPSASEAAPDGGPYRQSGVPDSVNEFARYHNLNKNSSDASIIAALGGEAKAETTPAEVYALLTKQANGESGALLTNGYANIFYVCDTSALLRAVSVSWVGDGWFVNADSVEFPYVWGAGHRVFSRDS